MVANRPQAPVKPGAFAPGFLSRLRRLLTNTGIPWRDLPERYGSWKSLYTRFRRWSLQGVWEHVLEELIAQDIVDESTLMLDSTTVKIHQHGSGAKKGAKRPSDAAGED